MAGSLIQRSFAAGEIAVDLYARADQTKYQTGLKQCRNFIVMRHGGATNRTGSKLVQEVKDSSARTYFIKFVFNSDQTYVIEVGNLYLRFYRNGARIAVSSVAAYNGATTYAAGDLVLSGGINYYCVAATTGNAPPNASYWYALNGSIYEVPTPYVTADLTDIRIVQSGDVITLTHVNYRPRELRRTGHTAWTLPVVSTVPSISAPTNVVPTAGTAGAVAYSYKVTAIENDTYEESLPSAAGAANCASPTLLLPNVIVWDAVANAKEYDVYLQKDANGVWGYIGTASGNSFRDIGFTPNFSITPPVDRSLFTTTNNYPGVAGYFQQREMFAATNTDPEKAWASRSGSFKNFTISSPLQDDDAITFNLAGRDVNEIRHLVEVGDLLILTSQGEWSLSGEAVLTPTEIHPRKVSYFGAAKVPPVVIGNTVLFIQARQSIIRDLQFDLPTNGYTGRDLTIFSAHLFDGYTIDRMDYAQNPHSVLWCVRSDGALLGLTYMRDQEILGWHAHDTDGAYEDVCVVPEGNEDAVYVMVRRTIHGNTRRYIERFASRRVTNVRIDALFMDSYLTYDGRNYGGVGSVTLSAAAWTSNDTITVTASAAVFVPGDVGNAVAILDADGAEIFRVTIEAYTSTTVVTGKPSMTVAAAYRGVVASWARAVDQVGGLDHLEAKTVKILADGNTVDDAVVTGGVVTMDRPYSIVHVGLGYVPTLETLDLDIVGQQIRDSKKKVNSVSILVKETRGGYVGPDLDNLSEFKTDVPEDYEDLPPLQTGLVNVNISATWEETGRFTFIQVDPLPVTILAAIPSGDIGG